jgi:hypothetical protein
MWDFLNARGQYWGRQCDNGSVAKLDEPERCRAGLGYRRNKFTFRALTMMLEPRTPRSHLFVHFVAVVVLASAPVRAQVSHQHELPDQVDRSSVASAASFDEMMHEAMTRMDSGMSIPCCP